MHSDSGTSQIGELVFSDICGPFSPSRQGYKYFVTFTDDFSKYIFVYPIKSKDSSTILSIFKEVLVKLRQTNSNSKLSFIPICRTDNGGEYTSKIFESFYISNGITHQTTAPYSSFQNGGSEVLNLILMNTVRNLLCHS